MLALPAQGSVMVSAPAAKKPRPQPCKVFSRRNGSLSTHCKGRRRNSANAQNRKPGTAVAPQQ